MRIHPLITRSDDLKALVDRLSEQPFVAVDTEFMRENTYWPDLCLIQVASIVAPLTNSSPSCLSLQW